MNPERLEPFSIHQTRRRLGQLRHQGRRPAVYDQQRTKQQETRSGISRQLNPPDDTPGQRRGTKTLGNSLDPCSQFSALADFLRFADSGTGCTGCDDLRTKRATLGSNRFAALSESKHSTEHSVTTPLQIQTHDPKRQCCRDHGHSIRVVGPWKCAFDRTPVRGPCLVWSLNGAASRQWKNSWDK